MSLDPLDITRVEAVLFDVGGVFLIPSHAVLRPLLTDLAIVAPDDRSFHRAHYAGIRHCDDELEDDSFWTGYNARYVESLGIDDADRVRVAEAIHSVWLSGMHLWTWAQDDAVAGLARIAQLRRVGIVSNADGTVEAELARLGVCQVGAGAGTNVEVIVDSTVVGVSKPNPEIFRFALEPMKLRAEQCLYIGDAYRYDVIGATRAGLQAVHYDPYELHDGAAHARARSLDQLADLLESSLS
jgi:putative hydrolase of the HAD superfamily